MKKMIDKCNSKLIQMQVSKKKFRKGDGGVFTMVLGAAIGALVLIAFHLVAKNGIGTWGESFSKLVTL